MLQQPVRAIAAAHPHQHFRRGHTAGSYVLNVGNPLGIAAGKTLVTAENCLFVGNGESGRLKAGNAGLMRNTLFPDFCLRFGCDGAACVFGLTGTVCVPLQA